MELLSDPQAWIAFLTLTALELVLGIDNIIFISILVDKLPEARRELARRLGLALAMFMRIGLLFLLAWISGLIEPLFTVFRQEISGRDLILIAGGLFLLWKSTREIHQLLEGEKGAASAAVGATFSGVILQIMIIDIVFSFDSIITAVGMVDRVEVMIAAVIASVLLMMAFAGGIGRFVSAHPTVKMLALAFLFVIGDEAAVIARVVDDVEQDLRARHDPLVPSDQGEVHALAERGLGQTPAPGDVPVVDELLLAPQLGERRVPGGVARREAVLAPFEVGLPDEIDHVVVVEGMDHVLEQALPLLRRFVPGQPGDGVEDELVRPAVVAREHARGLRSDHGPPRSGLPRGL